MATAPRPGSTFLNATAGLVLLAVLEYESRRLATLET
jgi:hypothetical protein